MKATLQKSFGRTLIIIVGVMLLWAATVTSVFAYNYGDRVQCTVNLNVRATASTGGTLITTEASGSKGTIESGTSQSANGFTWWYITWDNGYTGWSVDSLQLFTQPNLTPYAPSGWSDKIIVSRTTGTTTDSTSLTTADTLYINAAILNNGTAATAANFNNEFYVDGVATYNWLTPAPLNVNNYSYLTTSYSIGRLSAGTHTIEVVADYGGVIAESNEGDNTYTKTITVSNPAQPNLTPYQPSGWSDKIVVARTASSTTDSTSLTTADTLYVNAAVINNGAAATAVNFNNEIYVDGVPTVNWVTIAPLSINSYSYLTTGYSIGQLSAGTHTIKVVADYGGVIAESNEGDNTYTKTITVSSPLVNGLTIIPIFDSSITSDPQAATIEATINSAIAVYKNNFSDPVTVSIEFQEVTTGLGASSKSSIQVSYSEYIAALVSHATTTDDATALGHLPNGTANPVNGSQNVDLNYALARALGFSADIPLVQPQTMAGLKISIVNPSASETVSSKDSILATLSHNLNQSLTNSTGSGPHPLTDQPDGTILLNTTIMNLSATQTDPTKYSLFSVVSHEIDEVLGFGSAFNGLNNGGASPTGPIMPEDLFRYDQNDTRSLTTALNATSYFSFDGATALAQFNQYQGGDFGDWYSYPSGAPIPQVQDAFQTPGATPVLGVELRVLDVIGFTRISLPVTINASAGSGGTISPNGSFSKNAGDSQAFTATPNANYVVNQWLVDGSVAQNGGTGYTLYNIQGGHSVQVTFTYVAPQYTISASAGSGGSISPNGSFSKNAGDSQAFTATPNVNYTVNQWLVDSGVVQTGGTSYSLNNIQSTHSVQVTFTHAASPTMNNPKLTGTTFTLSVATQVGFNYILEYKNSFSDGNWTVVQTIGGTGGMITLTDTAATGSSRFYHVRVQ